MSETTNPASIFDFHDWKVCDFHSRIPPFPLEQDARVAWKFTPDLNYEFLSDEERFFCMLTISFSVSSGEEERGFVMKGHAISTFSMQASKETEENKRQLLNFTQFNAMMFSVLQLRHFIMNMGREFDVRKQLVFPNIDLRKVKLNQQYVVEKG